MGILSSELKDQVVTKLDDLIKLKGALEIVDGFVIKIGLNVLDEKVFTKIPLEYQDEVVASIQSIIDGEVDELPEILDDLLAGVIPTPLVDGSDVEKALYNNFLALIIDLLVALINKQKQEAQ